MRSALVATLVLILLLGKTNAQTTNKYQDVDALISSNSMIDAMTALKTLKNNYTKDTVDAEYWLRFSKASYIFYKYDDAENAINKAIVLSPANATYYFEKGLLQNKRNELEDASATLQKAIDLKAEGEYFYWKGIVDQQLKRNDDAGKDYTNALDKKFETAQLYNNFSILLVEQENFEKALLIINKAILLDKIYPQAYSAKSKIHLLLLNVDSACAYRKIANDMGYYKTFNIPDSVCNGSSDQKTQFVAEIFASNKQYKQSIKAFTQLIDGGSTKSDHYLNRGYCYYQLKEFDKAEKDYLQALTLPGAATDLLYDNLSLLYYDMNNFLNAIDYSTKRLDLNPSNYTALIDRGLCYRKIKKYKDAEKGFNKALQLKPDFFRAFGYRSFLYFELGQYNKAYDDAAKAVELNPQYGYGYLVLAQAKQKLGIADFCIDLYKAQKLGWPEAEELIKEHCK